jgi:hypothetical protein
MNLTRLKAIDLEIKENIKENFNSKINRISKKEQTIINKDI